MFTGRWLMSFWTGSSKIHELYTAACGLYVCWLSIRGITVLLAWMPQGRTVIARKVQEWTLMVGTGNIVGRWTFNEGFFSQNGGRRVTP